MNVRPPANGRNSGGFSEKHAPTFFVVTTVYEDLRTGRRAEQFYHKLSCQFDEEECTLQHNLWSFEVLKLAEVSDAAAKKAAASDFIIISMHGDSDLPRAVRDWFDRWLTIRSNGMAAMIVLLDSRASKQRRNSVQKSLRTMARSGGLDFVLAHALPLTASTRDRKNILVGAGRLLEPEVVPHLRHAGPFGDLDQRQQPRCHSKKQQPKK